MTASEWVEDPDRRPENRYTRRDRLRKRREYLRLQRSGRRVHGRFFLAVVADNRSGRCRLGVTVGKKVGNAVARNRVKRRIREYFRNITNRIGTGRDINIIARWNAAQATNRETVRDLKLLFEKSMR